MLDPILETVKAIEAGAAADPSGTLVLIGIGVLAIIAVFWAMER